MNLPEPDPAPLIVGAWSALSRGAYGEVRAGLEAGLRDGLFGKGPNIDAFLALRMLGEAARKQHDLDAAVAAYSEAGRVARDLHRPDMESAAVEGLALVMRFDGEPVRALTLLNRALALAQESDDSSGVVAVLSNQGNLLCDVERFEQAEPVLREALELGAELPPRQRAPIEDNLGIALAGLGRPEEAAEMATSAAAHFEADGAGFDQYEALRHLESHQKDAGRAEEAVATFTKARALISSLEVENLNVEYYLTFSERKREIEDKTREHLRASGRASADVALEIGARAELATELGKQADRAIEVGDFAEAEAALLQALEHWERLRAFHLLPSVHHALGSVYIETGQMTKARAHVSIARRLAQELGDPFRELLSCTNLARLALGTPGDLGTVDALQLIARARALRPLCFVGEDGRPAYEAGAEPTIDGGVIDSQDAAFCFEHDAFDLAEEAARRSIETIKELLDSAPEATLMEYRLWHRLRRLYVILRRRGAEGDEAEADELARRLDGFLGKSPDPRSRVVLQVTLGLEMFNRDIWTEETLERLVAACDGYEELRERALPLGDLAEFSEVRNAPFPEAIEIAIRLGKADHALELLERSKSRSLLDSLRARRDDENTARDSARPASATELIDALAAREASPVLIEFFVGPRGVYAFVLDGHGALEVSELADRHGPEWMELERLVHRNSLAGRGSALEALNHPALRRLSGFVREVADSRPVYLVPHGVLHALPLHLFEQEGLFAPLPRVYHLPSGSLLRLAAPHTAAEGTVVGGDPGGDLGFAALEAEAVGEHFGVVAAVGAGCSFEWLAAELEPGRGDRRLIHLACHALFQPTRGERSGLELNRDGAPTLVAVDELAGLDWSSELVVLSACSSGQHEVGAGDELAGISRALLGCGARALIVALWEVPDLATYILVETLYSSLPDQGELDLKEVGLALEGAQLTVRDTSARDLISIALRLREEGDDRRMRCALNAAIVAHAAAGDQEEARRCIESLRALEQNREPAPDIGGIDWARQVQVAGAAAYDALPFRDPAFWAAFVLIGRR